MGILITPEGYKSRDIQPRDGKQYTLNELYEHVGCKMVELVTLANGSSMWIDEEGKTGWNGPIKKRNDEATLLFWLAGGDRNDYIAGNAFVTQPGEVD